MRVKETVCRLLPSARNGLSFWIQLPGRPRFQRSFAPRTRVLARPLIRPLPHLSRMMKSSAFFSSILFLSSLSFILLYRPDERASQSPLSLGLLPLLALNLPPLFSRKRDSFFLGILSPLAHLLPSARPPASSFGPCRLRDASYSIPLIVFSPYPQACLPFS